MHIAHTEVKIFATYLITMDEQDDLDSEGSLDSEMGTHLNQVESMLPSQLNPIRWLTIVKQFLYDAYAVLITMHYRYSYTNEQVQHSHQLHMEFMHISEFIYSLGVLLVKFRKLLEATARALYIDHLRCFHRFRQVVDTDPQNEQLIQLAHCMVVIVERRYEMAVYMLESLDLLVDQCYRDFERTVTGNVHRALFLLEEAINNDDEHQLNIDNCRANLSYRAQQILSAENAIADEEDLQVVNGLIDMMNDSVREMTANMGYLEMLKGRGEHNRMVRHIFDNALDSSPLRAEPMYANVTFDPNC